MNLLIFLKIVFSLTLLIIFIFLFGIPSWEKFQAKEVMINKIKVNPIKSITPAVTICALDKVTVQGWKSFNIKKGNVTIPDYRNNILSFHCEGSELLADCINNETFNLTETIKSATAGDWPYRNILNTTFWIDELSYFGFGKCHTLNNSVSLGSSEFQFFLNRSLKYHVFMHDPHYFMITANPSTMPNLYFALDDSQGNQIVYIEAVDMDRPDQPCNKDENYSLTACVKTSVSRMIGCR